MTSTSTSTPAFFFPSAGYDATQRPKSPKSPKVTTTIENPLLKSPQFLLGLGSGRTAANAAPALKPGNEQQQTQARSPLTAVSINRQNRPNQMQRTPGPPPKASLSLMGMIPAVETSNSTATLASRTSSSAENNLTPPPIASPRLLWEQNHHPKDAKLSTVEMITDTNNWIVAYGYSNSEEYKELERILNGYGQILQQHSNGNWVAVRYESRLAAEKALCSQPIRLTSNSLCGTVRGAPQLLQSLRDQRRNEASSPSLTSQRSSGRISMDTRPNVLEEKDILAHYSGNDNGENHHKAHTSICEKLLSWVLDWDSTSRHHPHAD
eukprot:scaffold7755_cov104-Cylindrotheca_fusiformis.AAC.2